MRNERESEEGPSRQQVEAPQSERSEEVRNQYLGRAHHFGYKNISLIPNFTLKQILLDPLHMKLRICDRLLILLISSLATLDRFKFTGLITPLHLNLTRWFDFVTSECKIKRQLIPFNKANTAGITRDFNGAEYDIILDKINIERDFPSLRYCQKVHNLWKTFSSILRSLKQATSQEIQQQTKRWYDIFIDTYKKFNETPYIHAFHSHLHDQIDEVGDLTKFSQQSVEKLNDFTTREYFNATNKHSDYLQQMLCRRERIDRYVDT